MKETHILMGSISSGTLHPKHLIPCFLGELERINPKDYDRIMEDPYIKASGFVWEAEDGSDNDWWDSDETHSLLPQSNHCGSELFLVITITVNRKP